MKLYKDRYLLAFYKNGNMIFCVDNASEFRKAIQNIFDKKIKHVYSLLSHAFNKGSKSIIFIDAYKVLDDVFFEEDKIFVDFVVENSKKTNKNIAADIGCSDRTLYRKSKLLRT